MRKRGSFNCFGFYAPEASYCRTCAQAEACKAAAPATTELLEEFLLFFYRVHGDWPSATVVSWFFTKGGYGGDVIKAALRQNPAFRRVELVERGAWIKLRVRGK